MAISGLIISIISLVLSLFIFFRFEYKIKKQQIELNNYAIKEYKDKEETSKKAEMYASAKLFQGPKGFITIFNNGLSSAKNIEVRIIKGKNEKFKGAKIDELIPGNEIRFQYYKFSQDSDELEIEISWTDESSQINKKSLSLNMLQK